MTLVPLLADFSLPYALLLLTIAMIGAAIGSFANVVVYRLPLGRSLVRPASRCPKCSAPIRPWHNIPIVGWFWLRGRCRACGQPISRRYPLVEAAMAAMFVLLAWYEPLTGGTNLPPSLPVGFRPHLPLALETLDELWGMYAFHAFLLAALACAALTEFDGHKLSWQLVVPVFLVGLFAPIVWPRLHPIVFSLALAQRLSDQETFRAMIDGLGGGMAGVALGLLASLAAEYGPSQLAGRTTAVVVLGWVGTFLGWQTVAWCGLTATLLAALVLMYGGALPGLRRVPFAGCVWLVTLVAVVDWSGIVGYDERLGAAGNGWLLAICGIGTLLLATLAWAFARRRTSAS